MIGRRAALASVVTLDVNALYDRALRMRDERDAAEAQLRHLDKGVKLSVRNDWGTGVNQAGGVTDEGSRG